MPEKDSMQRVIEALEAIRGGVSPEEYNEIDEWNKGRALAQLVVLPGWKTVLEMLASYTADAMRKLGATDPKDREEVLAWHAVFYAASRLYNNFVEDVGRAVDKSRKTPDVVKDGLRKSMPAPPESMF